MAFFILTQIAAGVFQSTGWPSVVSVMGNWFGKSKRGLIMGVWNAHTSVGNILGSLLASSDASPRGTGGNAFVINGVLTIHACAWLVYMFLVVAPEDAGHPSPHGAAGGGGGGDHGDARLTGEGKT